MKSSSRLIKPSVFVVTALVFSTSAKVWADVHPNALFSDNAVLQQAAEAPVWGTAKDGEAVSVEIENQTVKTTAKDGKWMVRLKGLKAGGPFTMTVKGENEVKINNVLVGEVWICSGQSNMERQLGPRSGQQLIVDMDQEAAAANYPEIRHFLVKSAKSLTPLPEVSGSWVVC